MSNRIRYAHNIARTTRRVTIRADSCISDILGVNGTICGDSEVDAMADNDCRYLDSERIDEIYANEEYLNELTKDF